MKTSRMLTVIVLLVFLSLSGAFPAQGVAQQGAGLVLEAARILDEQYVDRVDRARLYNAALEGLRTALRPSRGSVALESLPPTTSVTEADRLFTVQFDAAVAVAAGQISATQLSYTAIRAMTAALNDSHTGFLTPEQNRERQARQRGQAGFTGVGIVLFPKDGRFYVRDVIPRGPAEAGGVQRFDRILRVNDVATGGLTVDQVASMIRGPAGTPVTLSLERAGRGALPPLTITRAPIQVPTIFAAQMLEPGIGYLQVYQFINRTARDVRDNLRTLMGQGMRALVLDVRGNSGGYLHELHETLNLLLPPGLPIYQETSKNGRVRTVRTVGTPLLPRQMPIVVLIDEGSASAAELLAAALSEHGRATLIGQKTGGAVEASILVDLSDGSALSVTIIRMSTGKGKRLEGTGLSPDTLLDLTTADLDRGQDPQRLRAVLVARQRLARTGFPAAPLPAGTH